jgi:hypothetical protein
MFLNLVFVLRTVKRDVGGGKDELTRFVREGGDP